MKWEYKTVKLGAAGLMGGKVEEAQLDRMMNELGAQGWLNKITFASPAATTRDHSRVVA